jgi:hypothetical protein
MIFQDDSGALQEITYDLTIKGNHMDWTQAPSPLRADFLGKGMNLLYQADNQAVVSSIGNASTWMPGT